MGEATRRELERRLDALQAVEDLFCSVNHAFTYPEVLNSILNLIPRVAPQVKASAALVNFGRGSLLQIHLTEEANQQSIGSIRESMIERYQTLVGRNLDVTNVLHHFTGAAIQSNSEQSSFSAHLLLPFITDGKTSGVIGCYGNESDLLDELDLILIDRVVTRVCESMLRLRDLIEAERSKITTVVESMVDGVLMTDQAGEIVIINDAARKMLHVSRKEDQLTRKYLEETLGFYPFRLITGTGGTIKEEIKIFDKTLHSIVSPVSDADGNVTGTVIVLRDITEQKIREERKNDFLSVISHELRTPLASIGGSLDLILKNILGSITDKQRRYLELARDSCQKLNVVIDDLLDLSKFEKGKMEIVMQPMSIQKLVEEVAEKFKPYALEKEITLRLKRAQQDLSIFGDYNRLIQVVNNLLSNAIKFCPTGGEVEVEVFIPEIMPPHIGVSVRDTGPGIAFEDLEKVFDKFEQVRRSDTRKIGGTGLGLAISRGIIEAHKGRIWAESRPPHGAKFIFVLPVEKRSAAALQTFADFSQSVIKEPMNSVILSDDPVTAYVLKGILLEHRFQVNLFEGTEEGLAAIRSQLPQLVLLDLEKTGDSTLLEILDHDPETASIPVIRFGNTPSEEELSDRVLEARKPVEVKNLLQVLAEAVRRIQGGHARKKILLIDDDEVLRMICREALEYGKYEVLEAQDGAQGLEILKHQKPDLVLLDLMLPGIDGFKVAQIIRSNLKSAQIPIIFITAKGRTEDKVRALKAGANDYLVKPFDSSELLARIESTLSHAEEELAISPTTKLPGSVSIEREIHRYLSKGETFALCYLDVDNLKSYNDVYGYAKADGAVRQTGDIIRESVSRYGSSSDFVGHVAGDDFVFITRPPLVDRICLQIIERFDKIIPFFYREEDRQKGFIEAEDRYGVWRKFPLMSISVVCVTNQERSFRDHVEIATLAAQHKRIAKAIPGSVYLRNGVKVEYVP